MPFSMWAFLAVATVATSTFLSVAVWVAARQKERESHYRHETLKKLAEAGPEATARVLEVMREEERQQSRKVREGLQIGGLITSGVGIALIVFLQAVAPKVTLAGLIPLLVGAAMLVYAVTTKPRADREQAHR